MKIFDIKTRDTKTKKRRFQRPEFQNKLQKARGYVRKPKNKPAEQKRNSKKASIRISGFKAYGILFCLLIVSFFLFIGSSFLVREVVYSEGLSKSETEQLLESLGAERKFLIRQNHFLVLGKDSLLEAAQQEYPRVRDIIDFKKSLPNKLHIIYELREPQYIWETGGDYYLVDQDGVVIQTLPNFDDSINDLLIIDETTEVPVFVGEDLNIKSILSFYQELEAAWNDLIAVTEIVGLEIPGNRSVDLFVTTEIGFDLKFDIRRNAREQVRYLQLLLNQEIPRDTLSGLSYIDLRLSEVAFYCYKDAPCAGIPKTATSTEEIEE